MLRSRCTCSADLGELLDLWGLRTFGEFARLPAFGIAARCGEEGVYWQQQTQGLVQRQLRIAGEPVRFVQKQCWEDSIETVEPLLFIIERMLVELCVELARDSGLSEDQVFDIMVCAAIGQATRQYDTALAALEAATGRE